MINPRCLLTISTPYLPNLEEVKDIGYEIIQAKEDKYYTYLKFPHSTRPTKLDSLFSLPYQIEPKPWKKISTDLYYKLEGEFIKGENYWSGGEIPLNNSILTLKEELRDKTTEPQVVDRLEKIVCVKGGVWDWTNLSHRATLLKENIPEHLKHRRTRRIKEVDSAYQGYLALNLTEPEEKFAIVINGDSGTQKTKLSKFIVSRLAEQGVILSSSSFAVWEEQDLTDKLERIDGKEVVILDDYSGENHKLGVLNKLTSDSHVSNSVLWETINLLAILKV